MNKCEVKAALQCCSAVGFKTACNICPYCYRCGALPRDALNLITEQENEIDRLKIQSEQANAGIVNCSGCKLVEINAVEEFAEKLKARITKFIGRHDLSVRFFNDIMSDLLRKYEK